MSRDTHEREDRLDAFADLVRQSPAPLSARHRSAGWQRLQRARATRSSLPDEPSTAWWPRRGSQLRLVLAVIAVSVPVVLRLATKPAPQALTYVVSGDASLDALGTTGGALWAKKSRIQLAFTDGSEISVRQSTRLTVVRLNANGADIRLVDGMVDVDIRHRPSATWIFEAGPYAVHVTGTSFALGWHAAKERLELRMRTGVIALFGPTSGQVQEVEAGQSVFLDVRGNPWIPPAEGAAKGADSASPAAADAIPGPMLSSPAGRVTPALRTHRGPPQGHDRRSTRPLSSQDGWAELLARGDFDAIVEQAKRKGIDVCIATDSQANLAALADAARYTHRGDLARRSLLALRARFPSGDRARDAAFFLARLSETTGQGAREALSWYDRYLNESAGGSYTEEALGREMVLLRRSEGDVRARDVARRYLTAYPRGIYASAAAGLLHDPRTP
jgi:ferric-dicitrate binding protein FerR (iron transport regulator)